MRARYALVPLTGAGVQGDPFRPDLPAGTSFSASIPTDENGQPIPDMALVHLWGDDDTLGQVDSSGVVLDVRDRQLLGELPAPVRRRFRDAVRAAGRDARTDGGMLGRHLVREAGRSLEPWFHESNLLTSPPELAGGSLSETFTSASNMNLTSHTADSGHTWASVAGYNAAYIEASVDRCYGFSGSCAAVSNWTPADAEYEIGFDVTYLTSAANFTGVFGRFADASNWYAAYFRLDLGHCDIDKNVAGSVTNLGQYALAAASYSTNTFRITNLSKKFRVAGTTQITTTDNSLTAAGQVGVYVYQATVSTATHLDNMTTTDTVSSEPSVPAPQRRRPLGLYTR